MSDAPQIVPISPAMLASQLPKPKPAIAFDQLEIGTSQLVPFEGTDLQWLRSAARHRSRPPKDGPRKLFKVLVHKTANQIEIARLE